MSISTGGRSLASDLLGRVFAASMLMLGVVFYSEIKAAGYWLAGVTPPMTGDITIATARPDVEPARPSRPSVELKAGRGGHFMTDADINGRRVEVMVDTGASIIALTHEDARAIGVLPPSSAYTHSVSTANGVARVAPVELDRVQIGDITVRRVRAVVLEAGKLQTTLLGNSFLNRLSRYEMRSGRLILEE